MDDQPRIGYAPYDASLTQPGDRRRFCFYAKERGLNFSVIDRTAKTEDFDLVVLSARADISYWRNVPRGSTKIVFDLIDSYLAIPNRGLSSTLRGSAKFLSGENRTLVLNYRGALEDMCRRADAVVCSTPEQRQLITRLSPNVHAILDSHAELVTHVKEDYGIGGRVNLVWEGLPYTLKYFKPVADVLEALSRDIPLAIHLVTDLEYKRYSGAFLKRRTLDQVKSMLPNAFLYQWNEEMLSRIVTGCDLALIPLDLADPLAANKPENKLLIFWRMGMPVVATATPSYRRVMMSAAAEFTCSSPIEWDAAIRAFVSDKGRRTAAAAAGKAYVDEHATPEMRLKQWDAVLRSLEVGVAGGETREPWQGS